MKKLHQKKKQALDYKADHAADMGTEELIANIRNKIQQMLQRKALKHNS